MIKAELKKGIKVEMEHKDTFKYIRDYTKNINNFQTTKP